MEIPEIALYIASHCDDNTLLHLRGCNHYFKAIAEDVLRRRHRLAEGAPFPRLTLQGCYASMAILATQERLLKCRNHLWANGQVYYGAGRWATVEMLKWILGGKSPTPAVLEGASDGCNVPVLRYLTTNRDATEWRYWLEAFIAICKAGTLRDAQHIARLHTAATISRTAVRNALHGACVNGHLQTAQWLEEQFGFAPEDRDFFQLCEVCENGHLEVAEWLTVKFAFTEEDARAWQNYPLRTACKNGHMAVVHWLTTNFALTPADARTYNNDALANACKNGHQKIAQYLVDHFGLTAEDVRAVADRVPRRAQRMTTWLAQAR